LIDLTKTSENISKVKPGDSGIRSLGISTNGKLVVSSNNDGEVFIWGKDGNSLSEIHNFKAHNKYILKTLICPTGK
jgi:WD40 repeat protein